MRTVAFLKQAILEFPLGDEEFVSGLFDGVSNAALAGLVCWVGAELYYRPNGFGERFLSTPVMLFGVFLLLCNVACQLQKTIRSRMPRPAKVVLMTVFTLVIVATLSVSFRTSLKDSSSRSNGLDRPEAVASPEH